MDTSRDIAHRWIKASVLAAAADTVCNVIIDLLSRLLSAGGTDLETSYDVFFLFIAAAITAIGWALAVFLTGRVLARKLADFPMRNWVAINALLGFVYGLIFYFAWVPPLGFRPRTIAVLVPIVGWGIAVNLLLGAIQALVLGKAARGLALWIACSALVGFCWSLAVLTDLFGPQAGFARNLAALVSDFLAAAIGGLILLPAVLRLRPRWARDIPGVFE